MNFNSLNDCKKQTFLFLQGHPSTFARKLAASLEARGARVLRVNFCFGDWLYWLGRPAINYRGRFADWPAYLKELIVEHNVTDIIYYGDRRPYHKAAAEVAQDLGIYAYVYEFGYLRPDWLTLERCGMTAYSHFPSDPERIRSIGTQFPEPDLVRRYSHSIVLELTHEIFYHLSTYICHAIYFNYFSDRYYNPLLEYLTGIPQQFRRKSADKEAGKKINELVENQTRFFLMPLQLQNDYQLRCNATYAHQSDAIHEIIQSFATHADQSAELVFKCHPLDNGAEGWPQHIRTIAQRTGVSNRVHYIFGGDLDKLLSHAAGTVLINSTVGLHALIAGCPTKVLGTAIYDIEGLAHQGTLDGFWTTPAKPNAELTAQYIRALAGTIQVKGNFFQKNGQDAAIQVFVTRLTSGTVNGAGAYVNPPPRQHSITNPDAQ